MLMFNFCWGPFLGLKLSYSDMNLFAMLIFFEVQCALHIMDAEEKREDIIDKTNPAIIEASSPKLFLVS